MPSHYNPENLQYLTNCFHTFRQIAREKAAAYYETHPLHRLPLMERHAELCMLSELHAMQAAAIDRQDYLTKGNHPQFLLKYFTSGNRYFTMIEQEKYQEALTLIQMRKVNDHLLAVTGIRLEIQRVETRIAEAIINGRQSDTSLEEHLNYLQSRLQKMQTVALGEAPEQPQPKASRGPAKKCNFGLLGPVELFRQIVEELNSEIHYLKPGTSTDDFIGVVTAPVPALVKIPIHIGCNNKQFMYVMDYFKALFLSFDAATIGNSGLFFSKEGNLFNSHNLNSTICDHIEKRYAIDAIFKKYGIEMPKEREAKTF